MELENVVLEVFARAFEPKTRLRYDGLRPYEHFLLGIARNVVLEQARQRELPSGSPMDLERDRPDEWNRIFDASFPPVEEQLEDREVQKLLEVFHRGLGEEDAQLFDSRFLQGLGQEDAAKALGLSRIQLRRQELALKRRLLAHLQAAGYLQQVERKGWGFFWRGKERR
jgi:RNA polymerase sigma factor (sigma-70 family)